MCEQKSKEKDGCNVILTRFNKYGEMRWDYVQCIRNDESAQVVHVTAGSLVDITKTTMKRDTQSRYDDVDCSQAWLPRPLGRTRRFG
ncbi:hypothetical protein Y032_0087g2112 [Ancylostoma ceylanicum]|uniref:Uncharacterized protein n=1 Tax=Ancylostoma ceylanicum TaxID=53326 RepID=A0A016TQA7_9BILA|nr:hypothetical protein Y032_0087g2112 [Ancylostoma ceylanicum]